MAMKVGGKVKPHKYYANDADANELLNRYHAAKKLAKKRAFDPKWKMAAAAASDRRLLIGKCKAFRAPR